MRNDGGPWPTGPPLVPLKSTRIQQTTGSQGDNLISVTTAHETSQTGDIDGPHGSVIENHSDIRGGGSAKQSLHEVRLSTMRNTSGPRANTGDGIHP